MLGKIIVFVIVVGFIMRLLSRSLIGRIYKQAQQQQRNMNQDQQRSTRPSDGNVSVEENSYSIKDRKNLSANGYMEVTILITPKGNIHRTPVITYKGIPVYDEDEFVYGLEEAIQQTSKTFSLKSKKQEYNLIDALKIVCRKYTKEMTGKKPFTNINLVQI